MDEEVIFVEKAINVARYIYTEYKKLSGKNLDEMKLHKLLYFTQRESLAITGEPMFPEEFEGWKYGPVCLEVRKRFAREAGIPGGVGNFDMDTMAISLASAYIAKNIILQYGSCEAGKLNELSLGEMSWKNARKGLRPEEEGNTKMRLEDIKKDAEKVRPYDSVWDMYYDEFEDAEDIQ